MIWMCFYDATTSDRIINHTFEIIVVSQPVHVIMNFVISRRTSRFYVVWFIPFIINKR